MDGACGFFFDDVLSFVVSSIIDHKVSKGNVAGDKVILVSFCAFFYTFKGGLLHKDGALP